jgi:hypothetical protein
MSGQIHGANPFMEGQEWYYRDEKNNTHGPFDDEHEALHALMYHVVKPGFWQRLSWKYFSIVDWIDHKLWR